MAKLNWTKPNAETIAYFERIAPGPPIQARRMFGMPSRFLNGHMLVSVFGDAFMLHLSETDREECIAAGARPFAPTGRMAKEYVEIVPGHFPDQTLKEWIARGMRYLGSLPPKLAAMRTEPRATGPLSARVKPKAQSTPPKAATKTQPAAKAKPATRKPKPVTKAQPAAKARAATKKAKPAAKPKAAVKAQAQAKRGRMAAERGRMAAKRVAVPAKAKRAAKKTQRARR